MALICRLYGEKDFSRFSEAWIPLAHMVATSGSTFNWGAIISKQLSTQIEEAESKTRGNPCILHGVLSPGCNMC
jgi:hypothetical protein